jgi:hypothetical protein
MAKSGQWNIVTVQIQVGKLGEATILLRQHSIRRVTLWNFGTAPNNVNSLRSWATARCCLQTIWCHSSMGTWGAQFGAVAVLKYHEIVWGGRGTLKAFFVAIDPTHFASSKQWYRLCVSRQHHRLLATHGSTELQAAVVSATLDKADL